MKRTIALLMAVVLVACAFVGCSPAKEVTVNSAEDLNGLVLGCQNGTTGETWVLENCPDSTVENGKYKSYKTGMDAAMDLKNGRIDAIVLDQLPAEQIVKDNKSLKIIELESFEAEKYAIAVAKNNDLLKQINDALTAIKADGRYDALVAAFMPADGEVKVPAHLELTGDKTLKVGTNAGFPPFEYAEGEDIVGFDISLSEEIAKELGVKLEVVNMEFDSLIAALQSGTVDFVAAGMTNNEDRRKNVDFTEDYYSSKQVVIVRK